MEEIKRFINRSYICNCNRLVINSINFVSNIVKKQSKILRWFLKLLNSILLQKYNVSMRFESWLKNRNHYWTIPLSCCYIFSLTLVYKLCLILTKCLTKMKFSVTSSVKNRNEQIYFQHTFTCVTKFLIHAYFPWVTRIGFTFISV